MLPVTKKLYRAAYKKQITALDAIDARAVKAATKTVFKLRQEVVRTAQQGYQYPSLARPHIGAVSSTVFAGPTKVDGDCRSCRALAVQGAKWRCRNSTYSLRNGES